MRALVIPALLLVAPVSAQTLLRFKPPVGAHRAYVTTMAMVQSMPGGAGPMSFTQTIPMELSVVSRAGNTTTIQTKMGQAKVTAPAGSPMAAMTSQMAKASSGTVSTTVVDEFGNLKSLGATGAGAAMAKGIGNGMMAGAQGVAYPAKALKVGDTWGASLDLGKVMGGMMGGAMKVNGKIPIVYRLTGLSGGTATIAVSMKGSTTMNMGAQAIKMTMDTAGTMRVETATGLLQSMTTTSVTDVQMGAMGKMRQHMTMTMKAR